jgi:predicted permease
MDVLTRFIIEIIITLLVSGATAFVITTVLKDLLVDLCGDMVRATFWSRFTIIMLFLTPLMFVMFFGVSFDSEAADHTVVKRALGLSLFGVFCAMLTIAFQISKFIPNKKALNLREEPLQEKTLQKN